MHIPKNYLLLGGKIVFIALLLSLVVWKADIGKVVGHLQEINVISLVSAFVLLNITQVLSAMRGRYYFATAGLYFSRLFAIGLYYVGMLFNIALPGGIGGDAYKVYLVGKLADFSRLKAIRLLLSDRSSGLFVLIVLALMISFFTHIHTVVPYSYALAAIGLVGILPCYLLSIAFLLKEKASTALGAAMYSIAVQVGSVGVAVVLFAGMGVDILHLHVIASYVVLFLISSIVSIIPVSIGGAGLREVTFLYGAALLGLNAELGIAFAFIYFSINLLSSCVGIAFWHRLEQWYKKESEAGFLHSNRSGVWGRVRSAGQEHVYPPTPKASVD